MFYQYYLFFRGAQLAWFAAAQCELFSWQDVYACHVVLFRRVKLDLKLYYISITSLPRVNQC